MCPTPITLIPDPQVLETPHDWPALCGFYGPKKGLLTNLRIWGNYGGELEVHIKDNHLALRSLSGELAKGIRLYRASKDSRLLYKGINSGSVINVLFETNQQGEVTYLHTGPNAFYKRPLINSLRFRLTTLAGSLAGLGLTLIISKIIRKKGGK